MKRFTKILISMLLLVSMIAGYIPAIDFTPAANAAGDNNATYIWKAVVSPSPGKTYLIANTHTSGNITIVGDGNASLSTGQFGSLSYTTKTAVNNSSYGTFTINDFDGSENYEWTVVPGKDKTKSGEVYGPNTFMFQNAATGNYLVNDVFETGATNPELKVIGDVLTDNYSPATRILFDGQVTINQFRNSKSQTTEVIGQDYYQATSTSGANDPWVKLKFPNNTFDSSTFKKASVVYHPEFKKNAQGVQQLSIGQVYFITPTSTENETNAYPYGYNANVNWGRTRLDLNNVSSWSGKTISGLRIDYFQNNLPAAAGGGIYFDSFIHFKNDCARAMVDNDRVNRAWWGGNGYYPSHYYSGAQFCNTNSTKLTSGSDLCSTGLTNNSSYLGGEVLAVEQYYYGFNTSTNKLVGKWADSTSLYKPVYYEKTLATEKDYQWVLCTSQSDIVNNGEYIIASANGTASAYVFDGNGNCSSTVSINSNTITTNIPANSTNIVKAIRVGDYYYLIGKNTGKVLFSTYDSNSGASSAWSQGCNGGSYAYGHYFVWKYDVSSNKLTAYTNPEKGEGRSSKIVSINGGTFGLNGNVYFYKKTYHEHTWNSGDVTTPATCSSTGVMTYTCSSCGGTKTEVIPLNPSNHSDIRDVAAVAPTCTTAGTTAGRKCFGCNATISGITTVAALGHSFTSGTYRYNNNSTHSQKCIRCNEYGATENCTPGSTYYKNGDGQNQTHYRKCTVCGGSLPAEAHTWNSGAVTTQPTCTTTGVKTYTCTASGCGATYTETVAALGHDWGAYVSNGNANTHIRTCSRCSTTETQAHNWVKNTSESTSSSCTEAGTNVYYCSVCNQKKTENVPASSHTTPSDWTVVTAATCTTAGLKEKRCTVCNIQLSTEAIPATGHAYGEWEVVTPATCTADGQEKRVCANDPAHVETRAITATGHSYYATVTDPTCTEQGFTTHVCSNCGDTYTDTYVAALGHDWGDWYVVSYPTYTDRGVERRTCRRCGANDNRYTDVLTETSLRGSVEETTVGGTADVKFTLSGNPGIWAQNFVIYFPKALTVESVNAGATVYEEFDCGATSTGIIPSTNTRMTQYFTAAGIENMDSYKAIAVYVDNGSEDSHADGIVVTVRFRVPGEGRCLKHYDVNLFGVFASIGGDASNWNGDSIEVVYYNGAINISNGIEQCSAHDFGEWITITEPTCTALGREYHECSICGWIEEEDIAMLDHTWVDATCTEAGYCSVCNTVNPDAPALGHDWGEWTPVREASGLSPRIEKRRCNRCSAFETRENGSATGTGLSNFSGDTLSYKYYLTDTVLPGHEYVIVNRNSAGSGKSLTDINSGVSAQNVTVASDAGGLYVAPSADSFIWNTTGTAGNVMFSNKSTGKFLKAGGTNIYSSYNYLSTDTDPFGNNAFAYNANGYSAKSGAYLGYQERIAEAISSGYVQSDCADPSGNYLYLNGYTWFSNSSGGTWSPHTMRVPFSYSFDIAFEDSSSSFNLGRGASRENCLFITPTSVKFNFNNRDYSASVTYNSDSYNMTHWLHFEVNCISASGGYYVVVKADGKTLITTDVSNNITSSTDGMIGWGNDRIGIDNFVCYSNGSLAWSYDFSNDNSGNSCFSDGTEGTYNSLRSVPSGFTTTFTKSIQSENVIAENVFTSSNKNTDRVYFYEKRYTGDVVEVYELVDAITAGETYVLVDANAEGEANLLTSSATDSSTTVYSDGISYNPYVTASAANEFTVAKAGNGYIFNSKNNTILTANGVTGTSSASAVLTASEVTIGSVIRNDLASDVTAVKVSVNGKDYYLYKKTQITAIDTALVSDFAVIDYGTGVTVGADDVRAFRENDFSSDRVDVNISGLVIDDTGITKNNVFYKNNLESGKLAAANSDGVYVLDKSGVGTLSLSFGVAGAGGDPTLKYVPTSANYETVQTFTYQCTVDRIGAYMYADLRIIPATTIYYEDNREGFITYTDGTYPDAEHGAKWETVETDAAINTLFGDEKVYGYTDDYTSYLMFSGNSAHKIRVSSSQITSGTNWMPTATFTFTGTGFDLISATSGSTTLVTLEITNTDTSTTKKIAMNSYFGYVYTPGEDGEPASWQPVAKGDDSIAEIAMYQVPIVTWHGEYGHYTVKIIPTYNKIMDVGKLGYSDFYLDAVRVYNPIDVSDAGNADVKSQYQADKELVAFEDNLRHLLIPRDSVGTDGDDPITGIMFTDGNGLGRTVNAYTDYTYPGATNEITVPTGQGVSFALDATDATIPERILIGAKVSAGVSDGETVTVVVKCNGNTKEIELATATDMYYDITDAIDWNGMTTYPITIYSRGIEGKDPHISLTKIKFTSGSDIASLSSINFFVSAAMEAEAYNVLAEEFGVELLYGDIDGDGFINTVDSKLIKKHMLGLLELAGYDYEAADIDGDGMVSMKDVRLLKKLLLSD